ncbi:class I SAM-dependent methyltransferase [bacterium]|nr:class I SAM-dependent methyltransferase [bacterium]
MNKLLLAIDKIDKMSDNAWMNTLSDRKKKELEFHDRDRDTNIINETKASDTYEKFYGNKKYYTATKRSVDYVQKWISKEAKNKIFLDYACGNGSNAISAAKAGALLSLGFDISSVSVNNAKNIATDKKIANIRFFQADAENTKLPNNSIDTIICSGMLHHLDLSYALPELRRILKPGGKLLAVEALDYNPAIKIYRKFTPSMRTDWEKAHILSLKDLKFSKRFFDIGNVKYWHVCGYIGGKFPFLLQPLDLIDRFIEKIPFIQYMSWMFTFELVKREEK